MNRLTRQPKYDGPERTKEFRDAPLCQHLYTWTTVAPPDFGWPDLVCFCVFCGVIRCDTEKSAMRCLQTRHHPEAGHVFEDGTWEIAGGYSMESWFSWTLPDEHEVPE